MTADQAVQCIETHRAELDIDPDMDAASAEQAIVEYLPDRAVPGTPQDRLAWVVVLTSSEEAATVHVDDRTGEILSVRAGA